MDPLAVSISIWIAVECQTVFHILVGACLGPLVLLRTKESTSLAFTYAVRPYYYAFHKPLGSLATLKFDRLFKPLSRTPNWFRVTLAIPILMGLLCCLLLLFL